MVLWRKCIKNEWRACERCGGRMNGVGHCKCIKPRCATLCCLMAPVAGHNFITPEQTTYGADCRTYFLARMQGCVLAGIRLSLRGRERQRQRERGRGGKRELSSCFWPSSSSTHQEASSRCGLRVAVVSPRGRPSRQERASDGCPGQNKRCTRIPLLALSPSILRSRDRERERESVCVCVCVY